MVLCVARTFLSVDKDAATNRPAFDCKDSNNCCVFDVFTNFQKIQQKYFKQQYQYLLIKK
jgi:hypothetical protein